MLQLGLKVWSTNRSYVEPARVLYRQGAFDFCEMTLPDHGAVEDVTLWHGQPFPFVLHAPHAYCGLNLSIRSLEADNRVQMERLARVFDMLDPRLVIFHPGMDGSVDETIRQKRAFKEDFPRLFERAVVENKPRVGFDGQTCVGSSPDEIRRIREATGIGFCFDIGHAICYATWARRPWTDVLEEFIAMEPQIYHLSDGNSEALTDSHENFGQGDFDLRRILHMIPDGAMLTIETRKNSPHDLDDFSKDSQFVKECIR